MRRVTNAPKQFVSLFNMPKGSVVVTVSNSVLNTSNIFSFTSTVRIPHTNFVLNPGFQVEITMANVSDFGNVQQRIVVFNESKSLVACIRCGCSGPGKM
ncbi:MAG: hypothetical protein R3C26_09915 [Calditrichia bacterium]